MKTTFTCKLNVHANSFWSNSALTLTQALNEIFNNLLSLNYLLNRSDSFDLLFRSVQKR